VREQVFRVHLEEVHSARAGVSCALGGGAQCAGRCFVCTWRRCTVRG